jgi:hypothetical protein
MPKCTKVRYTLLLLASELFSQLDVKDPLIQLANTINWTVFDDAFEQHYSRRDWGLH